MARISKYQFDQNVTKEDFVIGSDGQTKKTRNFKLDDLTTFFGKQDAILGDKFAYVYKQAGNQIQLSQGEISFNNKAFLQTPFSGITDIYINSYNQSGNNIYDYLQALYNNDGVLEIFNSENSTYFGVFRIQSINIVATDVIRISVDVVSSNGYTTGGQVINISGTYSFGDKSYVHTQVTSQNIWNITHNLNKKPSVTIVDDGDNVVVADVRYISQNQITITFAGAISGKAYLN
jgi:hypothetical protein